LLHALSTLQIKKKANKCNHIYGYCDYNTHAYVYLTLNLLSTWSYIHSNKHAAFRRQNVHEWVPSTGTEYIRTLCKSCRRCDWRPAEVLPLKKLLHRSMLHQSYARPEWLDQRIVISYISFSSRLQARHHHWLNCIDESLFHNNCLHMY